MNIESNNMLDFNEIERRARQMRAEAFRDIMLATKRNVGRVFGGNPSDTSRHP